MWKNIDITQHIKHAEAAGYRVVENQSFSATRNLVDSSEEHELLEQLIENNKPKLPPEAKHLHYLLATPFRYTLPLKDATRFGEVTDQAPFYGAFELKTAFAEWAYRYFKFLEDTTSQIQPYSLSFSSFCFHVKSNASLDVTLPPFSDYKDILNHTSIYTETHQLAREMRNHSVELCIFESVRAENGAKNLCLFSPLAFSKHNPTKLKTWQCHCSPNHMTVLEAHKEIYRFERLKILPSELTKTA